MFAGTFYPEAPDELAAEVDAHLARGEATAREADQQGVAASSVDVRGRLAALVAPHAGYVYSGRTAGRVFAEVARQAAAIERVVLLGPSHRVAFRGLAAPTHAAFATPLGELELDRAALVALVSAELARFVDEAHAREHSLEVELPFLQRALGARRLEARGVSLVPLVVGDASPELVARALSALDEPGTLVVVSSDLSHYLSYDEGRRRDERTVVRALDLATDLSPDEACGARPWSGLARFAALGGLTPRLVDLTSSGDTAGDRARVVGYAGLVYEAPLSAPRPS